MNKSNKFSPEVRERAVRLVPGARALRGIPVAVGSGGVDRAEDRVGCRRRCPGTARPPTQVLGDFVDEHRGTIGVEPICRTLQFAPLGYRRHAAVAREPHRRSLRAQLDNALVPEIERVWKANMQGTPTRLGLDTMHRLSNGPEVAGARWQW